jgi:hypothetical protein
MTATAASRGAEPAAPAFIEQLEWGKFCQSADGPIIAGADHELLGYSPGFPREVVPLCHPRTLGVAIDSREELQERLFKQVPHGTVFQPLHVGDQRYAVLYRVGVRSEGGSVDHGRRQYSLARFLLSPPKHAPDHLFALLGRLGGTTRDAAKRLQSLPLPERSSQPVSDAFLRGALTYVMSGRSIRILLTEEEFFDHVGALWRELPPQVRPLFSAGWNVSRNVAARLTAFCCDVDPSDYCAYDGVGWTERTTPGSHSISLLPGELYVANRFTADTSSCVPPIPNHSDQLDRSSAAYISSQPLMAFSQPWVRGQFCRWGLAYAQTADLLDGWIGGANTLPAPQIAGLSKYLDRDELAAFVTRAWQQEDSTPRGDLLLWSAESSGAIAVSAGHHQARARIIEAARRGDTHALLDALATNVQLLPPASIINSEVERLLQQDLDGLHGCDPDRIHQYQKLLAARTQGAYLPVGWITKNAFALARWLACGERSVASLRLQALLSVPESLAPGCRAVVNLTQGQPPTTSDATDLQGLAPSQLAQFSALLSTCWSDEALGYDRDVLFAWGLLQALPAQHLPLPLRIMRGVSVTAATFDAWITDNPMSHYPAGVKTAVAAYALRHAFELREAMRSNLAAWTSLTSHWDKEIVLTLLSDGAVDHPAATDDTIGPDLHEQALQELIDEWLLDDDRDLASVQRAASVLWRWSIAMNPLARSPLSVVQLCSALHERTVPLNASIEPDQARLAMTLIRRAGVRSQLESQAHAAWHGATHASMLRFLLELFPSLDLHPSPEQLVALIPQRRWLRDHLQDARCLHAGRQYKFGIATANFRQLEFPGHGAYAWRDEWHGTALSGAFREHRTRALVLELQAYGSTPTLACNCVLKLLSSARQPEEALAACCDVFLFNWAQSAGLDRQDLKKIVSFVANPRGADVVVVSPAPDEEAAMPLQRRAGQIAIADYLIPLLWWLSKDPWHRCFKDLIKHSYEAHD